MTATVGTEKPRKGYKGLGMEGAVARWYARTTGNSIEQFRKEARTLAGQLSEGGSILEVAPGPGFLAIELAKLGDYQVVGLDISKTFVELATENARKAGVQVAFQLGNAAAMPFDSDSFDLIVCRAAFKNFSEPVRALTEMYRVLKPGRKGVHLRPAARRFTGRHRRRRGWNEAELAERADHTVDLQAYAAQARSLEREFSANGRADALQDLCVPRGIDWARGLAHEIRGFRKDANSVDPQSRTNGAADERVEPLADRSRQEEGPDRVGDRGKPAGSQHHPGARSWFDARRTKFREHARVDHRLDIFVGEQ